MPYRLRKTRRGCQVVGKKGKRYSRRLIKCSNAKKQLRLLRAIEHGWKPRRQRGGDFACGDCPKCGAPGTQTGQSSMGDKALCTCPNGHGWTA